MQRNERPRPSKRVSTRTLAYALLVGLATLGACDDEDGGIPAVPGDDPTVNLGPLRSACLYDESWGFLEDRWCHEYYGSLPYTQEQWDQLVCPLGSIQREGCSTDPRLRFDGVCRMEAGMDGQWQVVLIHTYGLSESVARESCEDEDYAPELGSIGAYGSVTFYPPWE